MGALFELLKGELSNKHVELHHENQGIPMESISIHGLKLYYDREERDAIDEMVLACDKSIQTITKSWQLKTPKDCRVYILSSWPKCVFLGAPLGSQILLGVTLPFWLFDNFYVVFDTSVIAATPSDLMTIRNFIGIAVASLTIVASHNLFHKVMDYQNKGRPL